MPAARPASEFFEVQRLLRDGHGERVASQRTGVPFGTVHTWAAGRIPKKMRRAVSPVDFCSQCGELRRVIASEKEPTYTYLLGLYLGNGTVFPNSTSYGLQLALDAVYPRIVMTAMQSVEDMHPRRRVHSHIAPDADMIVLRSYWKSWPCLFPQHGPGRKHHRPIFLADWQQEMVNREPESLLRGLIHSDGWRGLNKVRVKGKDYAYPRHQFSNRSDDIRRIFTDTCDLIGVDWRPWGPWNISVARRESVATLDTFIGPKS